MRCELFVLAQMAQIVAFEGARGKKREAEDKRTERTA